MKKRSWLLVALCLAGTIALLFWGFGQSASPGTQNRPVYALVIEDDTGTFLMQLRKGMGDTAAMLGGTLNVYDPDDPLPEQAAAVLLWLDSPQAWVDSHPTDRPVLVIDGRAKGCPSISMDDKGTVYALLEQARSSTSPVAVVTDAQSTRSLRRGTQAKSLAQAYGFALVSYTDGMAWPQGAQTVVALSGRATAALAAQNNGKTLLGFDTGDSRVELLESGQVQTMALDNPYAMGCLAIEAAASRQDAAVSALLATSQNMYLPQNVKQVFPLLQ